MKRKIKKFFKNFTKRKNITALSLIVTIGSVAAVLVTVTLFFARANGIELEKQKRHDAFVDEIRALSGITTNLEAVPDETAVWPTYDAAKYNFSIKYPDNWKVTEEQVPDPALNYLKKISFSSSVPGRQNEGFEIYVYNSSRYSDPAKTNNLIRKGSQDGMADCPAFDEITLGEKGYAAKEVNVKADNPCYDEIFFYSLTKGSYTYNLVPIFGEQFDIKNYDEKTSLVKVLPVFYDIVSTIEISESRGILEASRKIVAAAAKPKVRFTAGARCPEKNDHPRYSKTKGKHMDEDCCPDPDEWPNPRCAYSAGGMKIMISPPKSKKK